MHYLFGLNFFSQFSKDLSKLALLRSVCDVVRTRLDSSQGRPWREKRNVADESLRCEMIMFSLLASDLAENLQAGKQGKGDIINERWGKVDTFQNIRNVSGEFIFILQMFTLQIVDKSTSYTFKIVN